MLALKDPNSPPEGKWRYPSFDKDIPDQTARSWNLLYPKVKQHYEVNGQQSPSRQDVVDWVCRNLAVQCTEDGQIFQNKWTNPPQHLKRGPSGVQWPMILLPMKLLAKEGDRGLGDIVARTIGPIGGEAFKKWYRTIFGKSCNCQERQETWNFEYPL